MAEQDMDRVLRVQDAATEVRDIAGGFASFLAYHGGGIASDQVPFIIAVLDDLAQRADGIDRECESIKREREAA